MKKRLLILPLLAGFALSSCSFEDLMFWKKKDETPGETPSGETASVVSVSVSSPKGKIYTNTEAFTLTATVTVTGNASKSVEWKSSDTSLAVVTAGGKVTPKGAGTVIITATSTFDSTKSGSVSFTINDAGYAGDLIAEGYEFVPSWPADEIKGLAGVDGIAIEDTKGFYVESGTTESGIKYLSVACDDSAENAAQIDAAIQNFGSYYDSDYDLNCYIDPTISYEVDIYETFADEAKTQPVIMFDFYQATSYFEGSKETTTDTAWNEDVAANIAKVSEGFALPFVALGKDYTSKYDEGQLIIYDQSPEYKKLDGYETLLDEVFEKVEEDGYVYYKTNLDKYTFAGIEFGFQGGYGNTIVVTTYLRDLEDYPAEEVAAFVDAIPSKFEVTEFSSENATYTYQEGKIEVGTEKKDCVVVGVYGATTPECMTYIESLSADGFVIIANSTKEEEDEGYKYATLQKGKIVLKAELSYVREATEEEISEFTDYINGLTDEEFENISDEDYYKYLSLMFTGTFSVVDFESNPEAKLTVYGDLKGREEPGLYVDSANVKVSLGKTLDLGVEPFELGENPTISYVSSNAGVATVDENGVVTPVAIGTATVTASTDYNEQHYEVVITVNVVSEVTDSITLAKLFPDKTIGTVYTAFSAIKDESDAEYSGCCAGGNSAIQLRSKNADSALYSSKTGGTIVSVSVAFNAADTNTKALNIVASNEPFESISAIHSATVVGTITPESTTYEFTGSYKYVAVVSSSGAHYLDSVSFVWAA